MKRILLIPCSLFLVAGGWFGHGAYLAALQPKVELRTLTTLAIAKEKTLPFYELMSPLPSIENHQLIPRLEYKKGPPERYIERISLLVNTPNGKGRERIIFHGRRTRSDFPGMRLLPNPSEAAYLEAALRLSQGEDSGLPAWKTFLLKPLLLREARQWLDGVESVAIMDQAGSPAFFFAGAESPGTRVKSTALFIRRSSFYRIDYTGDRGFLALHPETLFRKSFLTERRSDALEYLAQNLSQVNLEKGGLKDFGSIAWPILLLAANVSVDPSSLTAYFHFAGINALLYRSTSMDKSDSETLDVLRNNVLASEFYARDVSPSARLTAEIGRLARLLTRNFE